MLGYLDSGDSFMPKNADHTESYDIKARKKIAATIWHTGKRNVETTITNIGLDNTLQARNTAHDLCIDAVNIGGNTCIDGISGTNGAPLHPKFQWEAWRNSTVTFYDLSSPPKEVLVVDMREVKG